jgi:hypothetical protein
LVEIATLPKENDLLVPFRGIGVPGVDPEQPSLSRCANVRSDEVQDEFPHRIAWPGGLASGPRF